MFLKTNSGYLSKIALKNLQLLVLTVAKKDCKIYITVMLEVNIIIGPQARRCIDRSTRSPASDCS